MRSYEATYFLLPNLEEAAIQTITEKFSSQVTQSGGESVKVNPQGRKKLAYPIKGQEEGHFFVFEFKGDSKVAKEFARMLTITDEVLRAMVVKLN